MPETSQEEEWKSVGFTAKKWGVERQRVHQYIKEKRIDEDFILNIDNGYQGVNYISSLCPKPAELKRGPKSK